MRAVSELAEKHLGVGHGPGAAEAPRDGVASRAAALVARIDPRLAAVAVFAGIAFFGVLGIVHNDDHSSQFYLDTEGVLPAKWSAAILLGGGLLTILAGLTLENIGRFWWVFLGLFFCFMGIDEWRAIHESLETSVGVNWEYLYLPVVLVGGIASLVVLRQMLPLRLPIVMFVGGGLAWFIAQVLEALQWDLAAPGSDEDILIHPWMVPPEEILEMTGSALFGLAILYVLWKRLGPGSAQSER